jgi:hypothetical protein
MSKEFNPNPWKRTGEYIDRTYPSGVAGARPLLTPRIHCEPEPEALEDPQLAEMRAEQSLRRAHEAPETQGSPLDNRVAQFNRALREGLGVTRPENIDD